MESYEFQLKSSNKSRNFFEYGSTAESYAFKCTNCDDIEWRIQNSFYTKIVLLNLQKVRYLGTMVENWTKLGKNEVVLVLKKPSSPNFK